MKKLLLPVLGFALFIMSFCIGASFVQNRVEPAPAPKPEYSPAIRLDHGSVADVWRLHLDSKVIGACAVSDSGEVLIPLRVWGESQSKRVDWDNEKRAVIIDGARVPSPVFLILQTSYTFPQNLQEYSGLRHEVLVQEQSVIIHTCAGEGWNRSGC